MWRRERIGRVSIFRIDGVENYGRYTGHANSSFLCICICVYDIGGCVCCVQRQRFWIPHSERSLSLLSLSCIGMTSTTLYIITYQCLSHTNTSGSVKIGFLSGHWKSFPRLAPIDTSELERNLKRPTDLQFLTNQWNFSIRQLQPTRYIPRQQNLLGLA